MKLTLLLLLACTSVGLSSMTLAQSDTHTGARFDTDQQRPRETRDPRSALARPPRAIGPHICLSDDVIGASVVLPKGEPYGKLEDVVVYPDGEVAYAVVSFGGFLGLGQKYIAVPWSAMTCDGVDLSRQDRDPNAERPDLGPEARDRSRQYVTLWVPRERLANANGFDKEHWPEAADPQWSREVNAYYASTEEADRIDSRRALEASAPRAEVISKVSKIDGSDVYAPDGKKLGTIENVALDTRGRASFVVVSFGGVLGIGEHRVAVPWNALKITRADNDKIDKRRITLTTTRERLTDAPEVKPGVENQAALSDPAWIARVYDFFGIQPYWTSSDETGALPPAHYPRTVAPSNYNEPPK